MASSSSDLGGSNDGMDSDQEDFESQRKRQPRRSSKKFFITQEERNVAHLHLITEGAYGDWNGSEEDSEEEKEPYEQSKKLGNLSSGLSFVKSRHSLKEHMGSEESTASSSSSSSDEENVRGEIGAASQKLQEEEDEERPTLGLGNISPSNITNVDRSSLPSFFGSNSFSSSKRSENDKKSARGPQKKSAPAPLAKDFAKFEKHTKGIGSKLLSKMGYIPGRGLGADGSGIVEPIDVRQRPQKMGLGHGGFDERTEAARKEEKRKAKSSTTDDAQLPPWKRGSSTTKAKKKVSRPTYVTAAELIAESMSDARQSPATTTKILDLRGPEARVLNSISEVSARGNTADGNPFLKELKYNLGILSEAYQKQLLQCARSAGDAKKKRIQVTAELANIQSEIEHEAQVVAELKTIASLVKELESKRETLISSKPILTWVSIDMTFKETFERLSLHFWKEKTPLKDLILKDLISLDGIVVATIAPLLRTLFLLWDVLGEPAFGTETLKGWIPFMDMKGILKPKAVEKTRVMTPYESLMYSIWLPRVRQAIMCVFGLLKGIVYSRHMHAIRSNSWSPRDPDPLVNLMEAWDPLLPRWVHHNIYEQVLGPKIKSAIDGWDPRTSDELPHIWLFPWLPVVGDKFHLTGIWEAVRVRMSASLGDWHPRDSRAIQMLSPWKQVCRV